MPIQPIKNLANLVSQTIHIYDAMEKRRAGASLRSPKKAMQDLNAYTIESISPKALITYIASVQKLQTKDLTIASKSGFLLNLLNTVALFLANPQDVKACVANLTSLSSYHNILSSDILNLSPSVDTPIDSSYLGAFATAAASLVKSTASVVTSTVKSFSGLEDDQFSRDCRDLLLEVITFLIEQKPKSDHPGLIVLQKKISEIKNQLQAQPASESGLAAIAAQQELEEKRDALQQAIANLQQKKEKPAAAAAEPSQSQVDEELLSQSLMLAADEEKLLQLQAKLAAAQAAIAQKEIEVQAIISATEQRFARELERKELQTKQAEKIKTEALGRRKEAEIQQKIYLEQAALAKKEVEELKKQNQALQQLQQKQVDMSQQSKISAEARNAAIIHESQKEIAQLREQLVNMAREKAELAARNLELEALPFSLTKDSPQPNEFQQGITILLSEKKLLKNFNETFEHLIEIYASQLYMKQLAEELVQTVRQLGGFATPPRTDKRRSTNPIGAERITNPTDATNDQLRIFYLKIIEHYYKDFLDIYAALFDDAFNEEIYATNLEDLKTNLAMKQRDFESFLIMNNLFTEQDKGLRTHVSKPGYVKTKNEDDCWNKMKLREILKSLAQEFQKRAEDLQNDKKLGLPILAFIKIYGPFCRRNSASIESLATIRVKPSVEQQFAAQMAAPVIHSELSEEALRRLSKRSSTAALKTQSARASAAAESDSVIASAGAAGLQTAGLFPIPTESREKTWDSQSTASQIEGWDDFLSFHGSDDEDAAEGMQTPTPGSRSTSPE
jgi:hypothetical protein